MRRGTRATRRRLIDEIARAIGVGRIAIGGDYPEAALMIPGAECAARVKQE